MKKTEKKLVSFAKLSLVEFLVKDEATIKNRSESAIIERHILNSFLPENKDARWFAETCLYSNYNENHIGTTLDAVFGWNAAGTRGAWSSQYDNLLPFVQFAHSEQSYIISSFTGKEDEIYHFRSQLDSVCSKFELLAEEATNTNEKVYYQKESAYARSLLDVAQTKPHQLKLANIYKIVIDNWDVLKDWSITFRMLCDMAIMERNWRDTPETRTKLLQILKEVSSEWNH